MNKKKLKIITQKIMVGFTIAGMFSMYIPAISNATANIYIGVIAENTVNEDIELSNGLSNVNENHNNNVQKETETKESNNLENSNEISELNETMSNEISSNSKKNRINLIQQEQSEIKDVGAPAEQNEESEIITFYDEMFKKFLVNHNVDKNGDGEITKEEMEALSSIDIWTNNVEGQITNINELKYAKNLTSLNINNSTYNKIDISTIANLTNLKTLTIAGNNFTNLNVISKLINLESLTFSQYNKKSEFDLLNIEKCTKLYDLDINASKISNIGTLNKLDNLQIVKFASYDDESIDVKGLSGNSTIQTLQLSGAINNLDSIWNTKVSQLALYGEYNKSVDVKGIDNLTTLKELKISGYDNLKNVSNLENIKNINNLDRLEINLYPRYDNIQVMIIPATANEQRVVDVLNGINCNNVKVNGSLLIELDAIEVGDKRVIKYEDMGPIMKSILTPGDKLYNSNLKMQEWTDWESDTGKYITFDDDKKELTIDSFEFGELKQSISTNNIRGNTGFTGTFKLMWNSTNTLANKEKINIPDKNFEKALLENYDIDKDEVITTNDMSNIQYFILNNYNIEDLTGLEYGINIEYVELGHNNISDITPLSKLPLLDVIALEYNNISDVTPLKDMKLNYLNLSYNNISDLNQFTQFKIAQEPYFGQDDRYVGRYFSLTLSGNKVKDISPINKLISINSIHLEDNEIEDISSLSDYDFDAIFEGLDESIKQTYSRWNTLYVNFDENYINMSKPENAKVEAIFNAHSSQSFSAINQKSKFNLGDVNGDGKINVIDCTAILKHIKGTKLLSEDEQSRADINKDKKINVIDCTAILKHIKGTKLIEG